MTDRLRVIVDAIDDKKGQEILALDFEGSNSACDYAVICTGSSNRNIQAIADNVSEKLSLNNIKRVGTEGYQEGKWILIDCGDILINIFDRETREEYRLELLWNDAKEVVRK